MFIVVFLLSEVTLSAQPSLLQKGRNLFDESLYAEAQKVFLNNKDESLKAEVFYFLGRIAVEQSKYDEAVEYLEKAVAVNDRVAEYHNWLGVMYGVTAMSANTFKQGYLAPKIRNEFEKAAALDPTNLPTQWGLINYYIKAPGFLGGSWEKAFASANIISKYNKAQGLRANAFIHAAQKKNDLAEKEYLSAIQADPLDCENQYALAQFYEGHHRYDKAFAVYEGLIKKDIQNKVAGYYLGKASASYGKNFEKGITCLSQYLNYTPKPTEPHHADAALHLAMIYEKKGDKQMALTYYKTSLQLDSTMKEAKEGVDRLN